MRGKSEEFREGKIKTRTRKKSCGHRAVAESHCADDSSRSRNNDHLKRSLKRIIVEGDYTEFFVDVFLLRQRRTRFIYSQREKKPV